jgi:glycosyltransferase involved in cell wall biosynthesis
MNILQLTAHFSPNIGGVETHLNDLVKGLADKKNQVTVLTYQPLSTKIKAAFLEKKPRVIIIRLPWITGWFYSLVNNPILEFCYLFPGLFLAYPFVISKYRIEVIHSHGLVASTVAVFWNIIFNRRLIISTHSLYHFPRKGFYRQFVRWMLSQADVCLCLSKKSVQELIQLGIDPAIIRQFVYWIDTSLFKPKKVEKLKKLLGLDKKMVVLFVGRLIKEKGIGVLLQVFKTVHTKTVLLVAGDGPERDEVIKIAQQYKTVRFCGSLSGEDLVNYYNLSDALIVPSTHEEGFGRVILEALASGIPVIGSKRGSIPEALDKTVGRLIDVSVENIKKEIAYLKNHPDVLKKLKQNTRQYALKRYSLRNLETIIKSYDH